MGSRSAVCNDLDGLLQAAASADMEAFATLYDRTASAVFSLLRRALAEEAAAERVMTAVYVEVWRTASSFDPGETSGGDFLLQAVYRALDAETAHAHPRPALRR